MSTIARYREMAAEARQMAKTVSAQDIKDALAKIAQDHDKMANDLEKKRPFAWWKIGRDPT